MLIRLLVITFLEQTTTNALRPMVTYRALHLGATPFDLGLIVATFALFSLVTSVLGGNWIERWSERRASLIGAAVMTMGCAMLLVADSLVLLALSQAAVGLGQTLVILSSQSLLTRHGTGADNGFGRYAAFASVGQLAGPLLATNVATWIALRVDVPASGASEQPAGSQLVFAGALVASLAIIALAVGLPGTARAADRPGRLPSPAQLRDTLRVPLMRHAMVASMFVTGSTDLLIAYLPAYGEERGWSIEFVGVLLAARALFSIAARLFTGPLLTRLGRSRLLAASMLLPAATLAAIPLTDSRVACFLLLGAAGFWLGLGAPVTMHWVGVIAPDGVKAFAIGLRLAGNRLGQAGLPVVASAFAGLVGMSAIFWSIGGCLSATTAALLYATRQRPPGPTSEEPT